jgi:excisionase family DNA binding protein
MSETTREWGTIEAAAVWAGVSSRTIERRIADGTITAHKFGPKFVRIDRAELDAAMRKIHPALAEVELLAATLYPSPAA